MSDRVLILGASVRAAAASARRAGLTPFGIDLFADRDTVALCEMVVRCPLADYPRGLFALASQFPPMPWYYTGGPDNHPDLIRQLAKERELWGNDLSTIGAARDQLRLADCLRQAGLAAVVPHRQPDTDDLWVRKPIASGGGRGVRFAIPGDGPEPGTCYQRFVPGQPMSALFDDRTLLATHHQLIGERWLHAAPFSYCGNITAPSVAQVEDMGKVVADTSGLRGLWGIDFIDRAGVPVLVEVNPRYSASVEVAEFATGISLLRRTESLPTGTHLVGKAVYYAAKQLTIPASGPWDESLARCDEVWRRPDFADIPHPGEQIEAGQPVVTLLADGATVLAVVTTLKARAAELDHLFGRLTPEVEPPP